MAPIGIQSSPASKKATAVKKGTSTAKANKTSGSSNTEEVEQRILTKFADRYKFGIEEVSRDEFLQFAGYAFATNRKFIDAKNSLQAKGWVEYQSSSKTYRLTEAGFLHICPQGKEACQTATNQEFHAHIKAGLKSPKGKELFDLLADGMVHDRLATANALGYKYQTNENFAKSLKELTTLQFVESAGKGKFQLTNKAFPCGRPE
jgi:hypothetical protein